jgi:hypothetical protein
MARPIGVKVVIKTESVENGATNRNTGVFIFYKLLKLALVFPYSAENDEIILIVDNHLNYFAIMFTILLHQSKYFLHNEHFL